MEFSDPSPNTSPFAIFLAAIYDRIKCGRGKLDIEKCSTKHYLKDGATNSKFLIWRLGHFGNTLHNYIFSSTVVTQ